MAELPKYAVPEQKPLKTPKSSTTYTSPSSDRPYVCPYEGCEKAYIHEYKLNLHLRREHPGHFKDETAKNAQSAAENDMDEGSDQDAYAAKRGSEKMQKQSRAKPNLKLPPAKVSQRKGTNASPANVNVTRKSYMASKKEATYDEDEDSEETEEEREDNLRYHANEEDDEETEYED